MEIKKLFKAFSKSNLNVVNSEYVQGIVCTSDLLQEIQDLSAIALEASLESNENSDKYERFGSNSKE